MTRADRVVLALEHFIGAKIEAAMTVAYDADEPEPEHKLALESLAAARLQLVSILMALIAKDDMRG
jgi:hypothetical protein